MSEDSEKSKPSVCENFEPQAWRKTICKNCFQPPDKHVSGASAGTPGAAGKENKPPAVPEKPKPGVKTDPAEKNVGAKGEKEKGSVSLANSIKDKYEQLEKDKHGPKEPPKVAPKSTKVKPGLSSITDKYEKLKGDSKSTENIPSTQSNKKDSVVTGQESKQFPKKDDHSSAKQLNKSKFGSVEDVSKVNEKVGKVDTKFGQKPKFGPDDKISKSSEKEKTDFKQGTKSKFGSTENLSKGDGKDKSDNKFGQKSKFGSVENVSKVDDKGKVGMKLGQKSKFGSMENVSSADKSKEPIQIPIQRSKFGGSVDTLSSDKAKLLPSSDSVKSEDKSKSPVSSDLATRTLLNKLDDFSNELKAGATSKVGSTVIHKQTDGNIDVIPIPNRPNISNASKSIDNEALQNEMNELKASRIGDKSGMIKPKKEPQNISEDKSKFDNKQTVGKIEDTPPKSVSPERKPGFKLDIGTSNENIDPKQSVRRNSGFKLEIGSDSPEIKPGFKIDFKKSESPTKDPKRRNSGFKLEFNKSESPTKEPSIKSPEKKTGFKLNFNKSESPTKDPHGGDRKSGFKLNFGSSPSPTKDIQHVEDNSKVDLRGALKKPEAKQSETSKVDLKQSDGKQKFELPQLKSAKDKNKQEQLKENEKETKVEDKHKKDETKDMKVDAKRNDSLKTDSIADHGKEVGKQTFQLPTLKSTKSRSDETKIDANEGTESTKDTHVQSHGTNSDLITSPKDIKQLVSDNKNETPEGSKLKNKLLPEKWVTESNEREMDYEKSETPSQTISNKNHSSLTESQKVTADELESSDKLKGLKESLEKEMNMSDNTPCKIDKEREDIAHDDKTNDITVTVKDMPDVQPGEIMEVVKEKHNLEDKTIENTLPGNVEITDGPNNDRPTVSDIRENVETKSMDVKLTTAETKVHHKDKTDTLSKTTTKVEVKDKTESQSKVDTKGKFELPNLKSGKQESENKTTSQFGRGKQKTSEPSTSKIDTPQNKPGKISDLDKNKKVQDSGKNVESKRKVESPFLKSNKTQEKDEKKPIMDPKHPKTFEVPKLKSTKADEKDSKQSKLDSKISTTDESKRKFEVPSLKSSKEEKDKKTEKKVDQKQEEPKRKFEIPNLRSSKTEDKGKIPDKNDLKSDDKKKGFEVPKLKSAKSDEAQKKEEKTKVTLKKDEQEPKKKFELPSLKSAKGDDKAKVNEKPDLKTHNEEPKNKLDRHNLKSTKDDKTPDVKKTDLDSKKAKLQEQDTSTAKTFERPKLKSTKDQKSHEIKPEENVPKSKSLTESKDKLKSETTKDQVDTFHIQHKGEDERDKPGSSSADKTSKTSTTSSSAIGTENFEIISADTEVKLTDEDYACANESASDSNYLHVDTQVFTSSRNKTAAVISTDDSNLTTSGSSDLFTNKREGKSNDSIKQTDELPHKLQNGDLSPKSSSVRKSDEIENNKSSKIASGDSDSTKVHTDEIARLRHELLLMTERCSSLERENLSLRDGLNQKDVDQIKSMKQKDDDESVIKDLKRQLQAMEHSREQLEADNKNLKNTLKAQVEENKANEELIRKSHEKKEETTEERMNRENQQNMMEDMLEENEQLKQDIAELKLEMEEMYDTFRDQEVEEFRELQKELEITAKNCRILQFKLRKLERHNDQVEQDRNQFEDRLRRLQDQFQDRDAVSHIHSLEDELRMAKDVSVRLHDELDLLEEKRGKMEEENRHLTELLEQADRKQFRLELEVDKLRDKLMQLRSELSAVKDGNSGEPRKDQLNCAEFLAIHREVL